VSVHDSLIMRAIRGETVERPPVWAMRQAGRWDPEFNRLREGTSFYEFSEDVDKAAAASLLPARFGVDALILFYDITTLPVAMGLPFALKPLVGPVPRQPIRTVGDVERLDSQPNPGRFQHIRDLLERVRADEGHALPIIVFAGAPFTVASYCIGAGKDVSATRQFASEQPETWNLLLERLQAATCHFLHVLIEDGADLYQLFDSWAGMLSADEYARWAEPYHQAIFAAEKHVPRILFVKECPYLEAMTRSGADVISLGKRHDLAAARKHFPELVFQGNVDQAILKRGTPEEVVDATRRCVEAGGRARHIVNLNHGVDKATPVANFEAYVRAVKEFSEA
jgi:uroporphyrinogen decarboxylase